MGEVSIAIVLVAPEVLRRPPAAESCLRVQRVVVVAALARNLPGGGTVRAKRRVAVLGTGAAGWCDELNLYLIEVGVLEPMRLKVFF